MSKYKLSNIILVVVLSVISIISILPFYIMIVMGTYYSEDLFTKIALLPQNYVLNNFKSILETNFFQFYWNSFYIAVLVTVLSVFVSALTGFAFAKYEFRGRKFLYNFVLATMMIPGQLGLVAFVVEMKNFHWTNTHLPLIIPAAASAFGVFWMTQYIKGSVPTEVIESARIDGCNEPLLFFRIVIPFIKPAIATLSMLMFLGSWNSYLLPMILLNKASLYTLPLGIIMLGSERRVDYAARILELSLGTVPLLIIFAFGSKSFIRGISAGAVKG